MLMPADMTAVLPSGLIPYFSFEVPIFIGISAWNLIKKSDLPAALREWNELSTMIPLLFKEPNPAPIKYVLAKKGLIASPELRLPMAQISASLKSVLDALITEGSI